MFFTLLFCCSVVVGSEPKAIDLLAEWESLEKSVDGTIAWPWSPDNHDARLRLVDFYLAVGNVNRAEELIREQVGELLVHNQRGLAVAPSKLLRREAAIRKAKGDSVGERVFHTFAEVYHEESIEYGFFGKALFIGEYQKRRMHTEDLHSVQEFLSDILETVEKNISETTKTVTAKHRSGNGDYYCDLQRYQEHPFEKKYANDQIEEILTDSAYRSLAMLYAGVGKYTKSVEIVDTKITDAKTGFVTDFILYSRILRAMAEYGQTEKMEELILRWGTSDTPDGFSGSRIHLYGCLVRALTEQGKIEEAKKSATKAYDGFEQIAIGLAKTGRLDEAIQTVQAITDGMHKYRAYSEVLSIFTVFPNRDEKKFIKTAIAAIKDFHSCTGLEATQIIQRIQWHAICEMKFSRESLRVFYPFIEKTLDASLQKVDFTPDIEKNRVDGGTILCIANLYADCGNFDAVERIRLQAEKHDTQMITYGKQPYHPILNDLDAMFYTALFEHGRYEEVIKRHEEFMKNHVLNQCPYDPRIVIQAYLCSDNIEKAISLLEYYYKIKPEWNDLNTAPHIAISVAGQGHFDTAKKWLDNVYHKDGKDERIDQMRNAAVRGHLLRNEINEALKHARDIVEDTDTKTDAYYAIIEKVIMKEYLSNQ